MPIELNTASGRLVDQVLIDLETVFKTTTGDLQLAGELVRTDIRTKTAAGLDVDGSPFAPYSKNGPYYYNPSTAGGKVAGGEDKAARSAAKRLLKKITAKGGSGDLSRTGRTIKFEDYGAAHQAFGRPNVDLQGFQAPHMLDAMVVLVDGREATANDASPAAKVVVAIYGEEAARAEGHNTGAGHLPKRRFFGVSKEAVDRVRQLLRERILARIWKGR